MAATGTDGMPSAAPRALQPRVVGGASSASRPQNLPPHWKRDDVSGRWIDPNDSSTWGKVPRNNACPCGSGKKFKHCHGKTV
jgi:preprotein translocase subunit SecA